ncbi:MAG: ABC transporter permease [Sulfolobales archaeon]|nr:ABC transporter permease [Sulfolobales archaeon]MDW8082451.1 ABC transporter permease [Sulfolobales archaeon]
MARTAGASRIKSSTTLGLARLVEIAVLVFRKKSAAAGITLIVVLVLLGGLAPLLTPYSPVLRDVVAADFAIPDWAALPDTPRNIVETLRNFEIKSRVIKGDVEINVVRAEEGFEIEFTGSGYASLLLVSKEYITYPYRPAKSLDTRIAFNVTYLEGRSEAWYNVDTLILNRELLERDEKRVLEVVMPGGRVTKVEIPRGVYSLYDIVTTRIGWIYQYYKGTIRVSAAAVLPNPMRNMLQPYILSIQDVELRERAKQHFGEVNAARDLVLEKNTRLYIAVNITYYCDPMDFLMRCKDGSLKISYAPVRVFIKGDAFGVLGTTAYGNDVWTQFIYGARSAVVLGVAVATVTTLVALVFGLVAGYRAGTHTDHSITLLTDIIYFIPVIPLVMIVGLVFGRTLWNIYAVLIATAWPGGARIIRQWTMTLRSSLYVEAAKALGASEWRIMIKHIAPQLVPYLVYRIVMSVPGVVFFEAAIQLLGFGDPEAATWGRMINEAYYQGALLMNAWWWIVPPIAGLIMLAAGFVLFGMALDEIVNPRLRR